MQAGSWPYAPPHDFTAAPRIDASGGIHPALSAPRVSSAGRATSALSTPLPPAKALPLRRPYTVGDWTPSPPADSPPSVAAVGSGHASGAVAAAVGAGRGSAVSAAAAWGMAGATRSSRGGVVRLPPIPASMSGGSAAADSGHIAGESAIHEEARAAMALTGAATRDASSSAPLAETVRLRQYVRSHPAHACRTRMRPMRS